jgi:3-hydroxybutyryl-CoA dehydrogenase
MKKIAVIGAGTMGNGICHVFAQNGFQVAMIDVSQEALEKDDHCVQFGQDDQ